MVTGEVRVSSERLKSQERRVHRVMVKVWCSQLLGEIGMSKELFKRQK